VDALFFRFPVKDNAMIEIIPYDAQWPPRYAALAARLRAALGDAVLAIHHIGSTSVTGLAAKDIIDIQVTVSDIDAPLDFEAAGSMPGRHATDHCPPGMTLPSEELKKQFFKFDTPRAHVHVRSAGRFNQRYPLLCRDYLRAHREAADAYAAIKRNLARIVGDDIEAYYDVKDPVFDLLMAGAEDWAAMTGWILPPGD
jgi:GrpB-like predicted nucleotidyltransferase (UPF0157 family)